MNLEHKVALVTGGAHRVGRAIALALARAGMRVIIHYGTSEDAARATLAELNTIGEQTGAGPAIALAADLRDLGQIETLFKALRAQVNQLDVLVNSAANFQKKPFDAVTVDDWQTVMQTNLRAPFLLSQRAARLMRETARPPDQPAAIINIADLSGMYPWRGYSLHGLSKAGLIHLTRVSALELGPHVRVNAVAPGAVLPPPGLSETDPAWRHIGDSVPLRRTGSPDQVGETVVFLAQNDYITGAVIPVDGGEHLIGSMKA